MNKQIFIITTILFSIIGCTPYISNISLNNNNLSLHTSKDRFFSTSSTVIGKKSINFVSLYVRKYILKLQNNEIITYENAQTDFSYEFEPTIHRIIKIVFEAQDMIPVYGENHTYAYQILLKNGKILNLIGYQSDSQNLKLVYGMSTKTFNDMLHALNPNARNAQYNQALKITSPNNAILSKWNDQKVHFVPLVVPLPRLMGPF